MDLPRSTYRYDEMPCRYVGGAPTTVALLPVWRLSERFRRNGAFSLSLFPLFSIFDCKLSGYEFVAWCVAFGADMAQAITFGLFTNSILTRDQLKQLQNDNVVADDAKTLDDLGIEATSMASILPDYLWCYRPSGQYAAIKDSAKNLKSS